MKPATLTNILFVFLQNILKAIQIKCNRFNGLHDHGLHFLSNDCLRFKPLIVGNVEVSVNGQEGLLQEADPLPLLLL